MSRAGEHRSASALDLIIAATAAHLGLAVLYDDSAFATVARHAPELRRHNIHDIASTPCLLASVPPRSRRSKNRSCGCSGQVQKSDG